MSEPILLSEVKREESLEISKTTYFYYNFLLFHY